MWPDAWERAPGWLKGCLMVWGREAAAEARHRGNADRRLKVSGFPRLLLVVLAGEPLEETLAQPCWGPASLRVLVRWSLIFLMSFTSPSRQRFSRKSQRWGPVGVESRACRSKKSWFGFFSKARAAAMASWVLPHSPVEGFWTSWTRMQLPGSSCSFKRCLASPASPGNSPKKWLPLSRATSSRWK